MPKLIESNLSVDFIVDLMDHSDVAPRITDTKPAVPAAPVADAVAPPAARAAEDPRYWIAPVAPDYATRPEEFLERVVGRRLTFGVSEIASSALGVEAGDWICFTSPAKASSDMRAWDRWPKAVAALRDAHRFRQVLHLQELVLTLDAPIPADAETQLRLRTAQLTPAMASGWFGFRATASVR